ncbi:LOW QUALITY PROTEIN: otospiralin [Leptosomus discolor]
MNVSSELCTGISVAPFQSRAIWKELPAVQIVFQKHEQYLAEKITFTGLFFFCMLMNMLTDASIQDGDDLYQELVALPYWPFSSSDFWSYVEYFWTLGAYNRRDEMARALFAQFPFGSHLGYHVPNHEHCFAHFCQSLGPALGPAVAMARRAARPPRHGNGGARPHGNQ